MATWKRKRFSRVLAAIARGADKGAEAVAVAAKAVRDQHTPRRTGALLASGEIIKPGPLKRVLQEGRGLPDKRHFFTEFGTARMAAQPHMGPARAHARRILRATVVAELRKALK